MWKRKELKSKAKEVFKKSYWKMVLVSLILVIVSGGFGSGSSYSFSDGFNKGYSSVGTENSEQSMEDIGSALDEMEQREPMSKAMIAGLVVGFTVAFLIIMTIVILLSVFILNPFIVGIRRFFSKELKESTKVKEIAFAFDNQYKNIAKLMFMRDLYTFLWSLLLVIPGIIKAYEYRMIPYILGDNPAITKEEAFALSKKMMTGQKWKTFVLDLSFLGWNLLSLLTLGILSIFYVEPYMNLTNAELYNTLSGKNDEIYEAIEMIEE